MTTPNLASAERVYTAQACIRASSSNLTAALSAVRAIEGTLPHEGDYVWRAVAMRLATADALAGECEEMMRGEKS